MRPTRTLLTPFLSMLGLLVLSGASAQDFPQRETFTFPPQMEPLTKGLEEAGIRISNVRYHSSQPWPFPSSLMIGCHAQAVTTDIAMDEEEMADVRWFQREEVLRALNGASEELVVPGPIAIAHHLIRAWASGG